MNNLIEVFELHGKFWLPKNPSRQLQGTLKYTPAQGTTLELKGAWEDDINEPIGYEIILGRDRERRNKVTLNKCIEVKRSITNGVVFESNFNVELFLLNVHVRDSSKIKFRKISVNYSQFDEWVYYTRINIEQEDKKTIVEYKPLEPLASNYDSNYSININFGYDVNFGENKVNISEEPFIEIFSREERYLNEFMKILHYIRIFLTLALGRQVSPISIWGETDLAKHRIKGKGNYYWPIIIFVNVSFNNINTMEKYSRYDVLFWLKDIKNEFETCLKNWLNEANLLEPVYYLYFISLSSDFVLENKFLFFMQAIEAYHRRKFNKKEWTDEENKELIIKILNVVPRGKREKISQIFRTANELTLANRLIDILKIYSNVVPEQGPGFVKKVVGERHYLTHYDINLQNKKISGEEFWTITIKLRMLMEICLLKELGLSSNKINELIKNNWRYKYLLQKIK
jgi:hypothetical protein